MSETVLGYSGVDISATLASLSAGSDRAQFNMAFNNMQNVIIDRLNKKIEDIQGQSSVNNVDAFMTLEKNRLTRLKPYAESYRQETVNTRYAVTGMVDNLDAMLKAAEGGDADTFNSMLSTLNHDISLLSPPDGKAMGVFVPDGVSDLTAAGSGIDSFVDTATATEQVTAAISRLTSVALQLANAQNNADSMLEKLNGRLDSVTLSISASSAVQEAEQLEAMEKAKRESSDLLQMMSLSFEVQQGMNDSLAKQLQDPVAPVGSILNLFS